MFLCSVGRILPTVILCDRHTVVIHNKLKIIVKWVALLLGIMEVQGLKHSPEHLTFTEVLHDFTLPPCKFQYRS